MDKVEGVGLEEALVTVNRTFRQLARDPGFSVAAVVTLTLGIAANVTIFSLVYTVLLRPLPYKQADKLAVVWASVPRKGIAADWTSWPTIQDWRRQSKSFEDVATELRIDSAVLTGQAEPEEVKVGRVSANLFSLLGMKPVLGRTFTSEEERRREALVVISSQFWRRKFAGSASIVGKQIEVDHKRAIVAGVMPEGFAFPSAETQLWLPLTFVPQWPAFLAARQSDGFRAVARLRQHVTWQQAQSELNVIAARLGTQHPATDAGKGIILVPLARQLIDPRIRQGLWTLFGAVVLVLLIGCSNVASLLLARGVNRKREFAIRAALGAPRSSLIGQILGESLVLALVSGLAGLAVTAFFNYLLALILPEDLARYSQSELNLPVLFFTLAVSLTTAVLFGLVPAWQLSLTDPQNALRGDSRGEIGHRPKTRLRSALIVGQFALSVVLLSGTGLLIRSFLLLEQEDLGFTPAHLLTATINRPMSESTPTATQYSAMTDLLNRVVQVPGVAKVGAVSGFLSDYTPNTDVITEDAIHSARSDHTMASTLVIASGDFLRTAGIALLQGRRFSEHDTARYPAVALINETMARVFWPAERAVGRRFRYGSPGAIEAEWVKVIGVVGDMKPYGPGSRVISTFYRPYSQIPGAANFDLLVRCDTGNCVGLGAAINKAARTSNSSIPQFAVQPVTAALARISAPRRFQIWLLGIFSTVALGLATVGIYGLLGYLVSQRSREIGVRIALGATRQDVVILVVGSGLKWAGIGIAVGLCSSFFVMRFLQHMLFGIGAADPVTALAVSATLVGAAVLASYLPARAVAQLDPASAMRLD